MSGLPARLLASLPGLTKIGPVSTGKTDRASTCYAVVEITPAYPAFFGFEQGKQG